MTDSSRLIRVFRHDAFLSHRVGDSAYDLHSELTRLGCLVWFDNDERITNRRVMVVMEQEFGESRMVIAHLTPGRTPSPWTRLEIKAALASEQSCDCTRLLLYSPIDVEGGDDLGLLGIDVELQEQIGQRSIFTPQSVHALAELLRESNRGPGPGTPDNGLVSVAARADRKRARLLNALTGGGMSARDLDDERIPVLAEMVGVYARGILEDTNDAGMAHINASYCLYLLRNSVILRARAGEDLDPPSQRIVLVIAALFVAADSGDDRANAYMLLELLARDRGDRLAARYLRTVLAQESQWTIARSFMPQEGEASTWWPRHLVGIERRHLAAYSHTRVYVEPELVPLLGDEVRLRLTAATGLSNSLLPDAYQIELELHWIAVVAQLYSDDPNDWRVSFEQAGIHGGGGVEIELALRRAHDPLSRLLTHYEDGEAEEAFEHVLARFAAVIDELVTVSESNKGRPLSEYRSYFVDGLLPILGLLVEYGELCASETLARKTITLMAVHVPWKETEAYSAMIEDCVDARACAVARTAMPVRIEFGKISILAPDFRRRWG